MKKALHLSAMILLFLPVTLTAQQLSDEEIFSMSLEELMNIEVSVATKQSLSIRETPGVVSVISKDDIRNSGARDLLELLRIFVPGVDFGVDVEGVVGIGMRGLWSNEGKVLLLINGMEVNEDMFATTQLGNRYNPENIERVEIIRGPGSAVYGGYASMGVINIITHDKNNSGYASLQSSMLTQTYSHLNFAGGGGINKNDFKLNLNASYNLGNRSQEKITDYSLNTNSMEDSSAIRSIFVDLTAHYKGLKFYGLIDNYQLNYIDLWGTNFTDYVIKEDFNTSIGYLEYTMEAIDNLKLTPWIQYKFQQPWNTDIPEKLYSNQKHIQKSSAGINVDYIFDKNSLNGGLSFYNQQLALPDNPTAYEEPFQNGKEVLVINNFTAFAQGVFIFSSFNLTLGGRYDHSDEFGGSFVPRIGLTKAFDKLHIKLITAQAFRIPGGILINRQPVGTPKIHPEKSTNFEIEIGYKLTRFSWLTINAFYSLFNDIITYSSDTSGIGSYKNAGKLGTAGIEADYKISLGNFSGGITYSYYQPLFDTIYTYRIKSQKDYFLGFAKHKIGLFASYKIRKNVFWNANASIYGTRYSYTHADNNGNDVLTKHNPQAIINTNVRIDKFLVDNLELTLGVNNLLNEKVYFLAPYISQHGPLPSHGISFMGRIRYSF